MGDLPLVRVELSEPDDKGQMAVKVYVRTNVTQNGASYRVVDAGKVKVSK